MGLENKFVPPRIPESAWWIIRDQFIKSMPNQVTATYISSLLDASDTYAKFILSFLKKVSLLDESSNPTNLTQQWCDDNISRCMSANFTNLPRRITQIS